MKLLSDATAFGRAHFGEGAGKRIVLDDVDCSGSENRLFDCPHLGLGINNCGHSEDASVRCLLIRK